MKASLLKTLTETMLKKKQFSLNGPFFVDDTMIISYPTKNGKITLTIPTDSIVYLKNGVIHRDDGPAFIVLFYSTPTINEETWFKDGLHHRTNGPAYKVYFRNGKVKLAQWFFENKLHRIGLPAEQRFDKDGVLKETKYYLNGKAHRENGPAKNYNISGTEPTEFWFKGKQISEKDLSTILSREEIAKALKRL